MRAVSPTALIALAAGAVPAFAPSAVHAQDPLRARYDSAYFAWQDGDYVSALERLQRLIRADGGERFLEPAALLTGELYRTVEVAPHGEEVRWSPDGRRAAYEVEGDAGVSTHLIRLDDARVVDRARVAGHGLVFDPAGDRAAYLAPPATDEHGAAREALDRSIEVTDFRSYRAKQRALARFDAEHARLLVRDLRSGDERELRPGGLAARYELAWASDGTLYVVGAPPGGGDGVTHVYAVGTDGGGGAERITRGPGMKSGPVPVAGGRYLLHSAGGEAFVVVDLAEGREMRFEGEEPAVAEDGSALAFLASGGRLAALETAAARAGGDAAAASEDEAGENAIVVVPLEGELRPRIVVRTDDRLDNPALSSDGGRVVYQRMPREDWELFVVGADGADGRRVTWDIGDDLFPRFVDDGRVLAVIGEGRHRRSFLHDLDALALARSTEIASGAPSGSPGGVRGEAGAPGSDASRPSPAVATAGAAGAAAATSGPTDASPAGAPTAVRPTSAVRVRTRLFHNNTVRTIAPEYEWAVSPDATRVLIVSERDGDTISPERGVYLVDLTRTVTRDELLDRIDRMLRGERTLRTWGERAFAPVADAVRAAVADVSVSRVYEYERELFTYGSKFITEPGNHRAIAYLKRTLESFGYEVELEWFEPEGERTANVIATLRGTTNPELVYVVSSHFDSSSRGPGADDNTSGTAALLETARVLAGRPQRATIQFAFFTGEEAGLHGSREFVRRAVANGKNVVGALNNDMVGFANDQRLDNTIRYSNAGIRDLQHAAALLFTDLILYDAHYYKSTDAHALFDGYGDVIGGIGSHPVLSSPHYHEPHDVLEIVNHRLITEVAKTTVASIMRLASSPARLTGLEVVERDGDAVELRWNAAPERDVRRYVVAWGREDVAPRRTVETTVPHVRLQGIEPGTAVRVKAVNAAGLDGWDWARVDVETGG